jgi:hypothetical protein
MISIMTVRRNIRIEPQRCRNTKIVHIYMYTNIQTMPVFPRGRMIAISSEIKYIISNYCNPKPLSLSRDSIL